MRTTLYDYCIQQDRPELLEQWHPTKNENLTPREVTHGSKRKVWWRCSQGHEWQTAVYTRTGPGSGCPYCAGKRPWPGGNDLASQRPDIAAQWHPTKNRSMTPAGVTVGSQYVAWWLCAKGHEWRAMVKTRTNGAGCPVCTNRVLRLGINDLASIRPDLARQWHPTKNGVLTPQELLAGTHRRVWWQCERGHEWQATVTSRTSGGAGCPVCAGKTVIAGENDLATHFPAIAAQWHPTKNGGLTPQEVSPYSNRKVWWLCPLGHEYQAGIGGRTASRSDCPYCSNQKALAGFNDLATLEPGVAAQWHPTLNGALTPEMVVPGSHRKVWWQCAEGHVWKAVVYSRAGSQKCGCPVCAGKVKPARLERRWAVAESGSPLFRSDPRQNKEKDGVVSI